MHTPPVFAIEPAERDYAWGSTTALQTLLGREPDGRPLAELWYGAHPDGPARVPGLDTTLDALITADPTGLLGPATAARFGDALPFVIKLLAAHRPLSIQVHPDRAQAVAGFAAEDARGIARDAPERDYRDRNHKPELLCALTDFEALCGFRPVATTLRLLDTFDLPELEPLRELLAGPRPVADALAYLVRLPEPGPLVTAVAARADALTDPQWTGAAAAVRAAADAFPGDVGVVITLLLNPVRLRPGEAIYLAPGTPHCYLRGTGVEVLASSDNVLRCGLTPKHVDADELLAVTDFAETDDPRWEPEHADWFRPPIEDFEAFAVDLDDYRKPGREAGECATGTAGLPYVVLCVSGGVRVQVGGAVVELAAGQAAFVPARDEAFTLRGSGRTFLASPSPSSSPTTVAA